MRRIEVLFGLVLATVLGLLLGALIMAAAIIVMAMMLAMVPILLTIAAVGGLLALILIKTPAGPWLLEHVVRPTWRVRWYQGSWRRVLSRSPRNGHDAPNGQH